MKAILLSFLCIINYIRVGEADEFLFGHFPTDFRWGASTAAYQIEGGWNADGKGPNIWDYYVQQPGNIADKSTGDIACDSYHKYKEDVQMLKQLGVNTYRFSISWARILPTGSLPTNPIGIQYYKNLIAELKNNSIEPFVTLYHNDLPEQLQRYGGWLNPRIVSDFATFAKICFQEFGDDVKNWITINEPWGTAALGYGKAMGAPGVWGPGTNTYIAGHNLIKSHVAAYRLYQKEFKPSQGGQVGITLNCNWFEPKDPKSDLDVAAQERGIEFLLGWYANAIYVNGDYPQIMKDLIMNKTQQLTPGQPSRLPTFSDSEKADNKGSADFLGLNFYSSWLVTSKVQECNPPTYDCDSDTVTQPDTTYYGQAAPSGLRKMLNWIKKKYNNINVYITENGASDTTGTIQDEQRIEYLRNYTNEALKAITLDSCNLKGYMVWSLMDNFEWTSGFSVKYGLYHVDFTDLKRPRTAKSSVTFYKKLIEDNGFTTGYNMEGGHASGTVPYEDQFDIYYGDFPTDFKWSVSSITDKNWYKSWKPEDVQLLKTLGVKQYQVILSWGRIFPDGTKASFDETAMEYYKNIFRELKKNDIEPVAVLHNGNPPSVLGVNLWLHNSTIGHFVDYADICFQNLGDMVKMWITIEDPQHTASLVDEEHADTYPYIFGRNILLAHASVYKLYNDSYKATQKGKVGIAIQFVWAEPSEPLESRNVELAERYMQMRSGWFASPILGTGDYPEIMKNQMKFAARYNKLNHSRLPELTADDQQLINGSSDFLVMKYMETVLLEGFKGAMTFNVVNDRMVKTGSDPSWLGSDLVNIKVTPFAIRKMLNWIKNEYDNPPVYVLSGFYDKNGTLHDEHRIHYFRTYINNVLKATNFDGCNVKGFSAFSLLDSDDTPYKNELHSSLYSASESESPVPKSSANWYAMLTRNNGFKPGYNSMGGRGTAPTYTTQFLYDTFPKDFIFSVATAATQIEGAWDEDGKGENIWDLFAMHGNCKGAATPKIACDSYHRYKEDVQMLKDLGVEAYRFSIAWTRIMPDGTLASKNQKGIEYYNHLINELISNDIKPMVTIYHWDLPQALQEHGGWLNESIIQRYQEYAGLLFSLYGDRVHTWITLNEPWVFTYKGYGDGSFAPGINDSPGVYPYIVAHNAIRAHAAAYHQYHDVYKGSGKIGITLNIDWQEPKDSDNTDDVQASDWALQSFLGWFAHPIYVNGDYPEYMKTRIASVSSQQGFVKSRLPEFTPEEMKYVNGSSDFFGLNSYSTNLVEKVNPLKAGKEEPHYMNDRGISSGFDPSWENTGSDWLKPVPYGLRKILNWIKTHYGNPEILITENGVSDNTGDLDDTFRTRFIGNYVNEVLKAIKFDNVNVIGYTHWSLMDNFEWASGYTEKFGLYKAGPYSPKREAKKSATYYATLIKDHGFMKDSLTDLHAAPEETELSSTTFPDKFSWGSSAVGYGSSSQMKDLLGESESTVDLMIQAKNLSQDVSPSHRLDDLIDVQNFRTIKATHAYISLKWSMILPNITADQVSTTGVQYTKYILSEFKTEEDGYEVDPIVSLYWWNLPADLETEYGGWLNDSTVDLFVDYARVCFQNFGDKVKYWITFDEPLDAALNAYERGVYYPLKTKSTDELYRAVHNMIKAHVRVYHMYQREFKNEQKGSVGIALNGDWYEPYSQYDPADYHAALRAREFQFGWIGDPILKTGDYPKTMKDRIGNRLPKFSAEEQELNKGTYDFIGLANYAVYKIQGMKGNGNETSFDNDRMGKIMKNEENRYENYKPRYIRKSLQEVKKRFGKVPIFISGNSISDEYDRMEYIKATVHSILEAIRIDGCDVKGYTYSPLIDGTVWKRYMYKRQGLYSISGNYGNEKPKDAAFYMQILATNNGFPPVNENSKTTAVTGVPTRPSRNCYWVVDSSSPGLNYSFTFVFTVIFIAMFNFVEI